MSRANRIIVGGVSYVIDEDRGKTIETIVDEIRKALTQGRLAEVPVLEANGNRVTLLLAGGHAGAVVLDIEPWPKPHEMSP